MQVTKSAEDDSSLPNGDVAGEAQSTLEVRVGVSLHRPVGGFPQSVSVALISLDLCCVYLLAYL